MDLQLGAVLHTFAITKQGVLAQPDSLGFSDTQISTDSDSAELHVAQMANHTAGLVLRLQLETSGWHSCPRTPAADLTHAAKQVPDCRTHAYAMKRTSVESSERISTSVIKVRHALHREIAVQAGAVQTRGCFVREAGCRGSWYRAYCRIMPFRTRSSLHGCLKLARSAHKARSLASVIAVWPCVRGAICLLSSSSRHYVTRPRTLHTTQRNSTVPLLARKRRGPAVAPARR